MFLCLTLVGEKRNCSGQTERGRRVSEERKKTNSSTTKPPVISVLWLDSNVEHKRMESSDATRRAQTGALRSQVGPKNIPPPPIWEVKDSRGGETLKPPLQSPRHVSAGAPASPATKTHPLNQTPKHAPLRTLKDIEMLFF